SMDATATSPDGCTLFAVSHQQRTLLVRDVANGMSLATMTLPYGQRAIALHPWLPRLAAADDLGDITFLNLEDRTPGPLLVSVCGKDGQGEARCPVCRQTFAVSPDQLGGESRCPHDGCGAWLRLSPFVLQAAGEILRGESAP